METVSIDRFEDEQAVCVRDDLTSILIKRDYLPAGAKAGSVLTISDDGKIAIDKNEESIRRKHIAELYKTILHDEDK